MFFIAAPEVDVDDAVEVDWSDCVAFAIEALWLAKLVLIELNALKTVEECAANEELATDCDERELELMEG